MTFGMVSKTRKYICEQGFHSRPRRRGNESLVHKLIPFKIVNNVVAHVAWRVIIFLLRGSVFFFNSWTVLRLLKFRQPENALQNLT